MNAISSSISAERGASARVAQEIAGANTVGEAFALAATDGLPLGDAVAAAAWDVAAQALRPGTTELETIVFDRAGVLVGRAVSPLLVTRSSRQPRPAG